MWTTSFKILKLDQDPRQKQSIGSWLSFNIVQKKKRNSVYTYLPATCIIACLKNVSWRWKNIHMELTSFFLITQHDIILLVLITTSPSLIAYNLSHQTIIIHLWTSKVRIFCCNTRPSAHGTRLEANGLVLWTISFFEYNLIIRSCEN